MIANEVEKLRETATGKKLESNELKRLKKRESEADCIRAQIISKSESSLESLSEASRMTAASAAKLSDDK
jgi:hypothetical protein